MTTSLGSGRSEPPVAEAKQSVAPQASAFRTFNAMDCSMLAVNEALRTAGGAGFETQTVLWLKDRVDADRLRMAVSHLSRTFPVIASRLGGDERRGRPAWVFRPGAECPLQETTLDASDRDSVLSTLAGLLSTPRDLHAADPVSFHLLHLPDGRDVFLMQYNHSLMDNAAAAHALRLLSTAAVDGPGQISAANESHDPMGDWLVRMTRTERLRVAFRTARLRLQSLRGTTARFGEPRSFGEALPARILTWHLDREQTRQLQSRVVELCRFPALSMALLGCSFRALAALSPPGSDDDNLIAGIGLDLGLRRPEGPVFQNLVSLVPLCARRGELHDRDGLIRLLNSQMRDRLQQRIDAGVIALSDLFRPMPGFVRWSTSRLMQRGYSFWYAYFGSTDIGGETFCGVELEDLIHIGPAWPPLGITLIVNQFRGQLRFQLTYLPDVVPQPLANRFLDTVLDDLHALAGQH